MTVHPSFEELAPFVFGRQIDGAYFRQAARLNAHISACPDCKEVYSIMLSACDSAEALAAVKRRRVTVEHPMSILELLRSGQAFALRIHSLLQISADGLAMSHPLRPAMVKASEPTGNENQLLLSVLSDGEGNRIRVDEDGSLTLYFMHKLLPVNTQVRLMPENSLKPERVGTVTEYDALTSSVCFDGIEPGDFRIQIER